MNPDIPAHFMPSKFTTPFALLALACAWAPLDLLHSQTLSPQLAAESERAIVRSQEDLLRARSLMNAALEKQSHNDLKEAYEFASESIQLAPSGEAARKERAALVGSYTTIALSYARKLISDGVFTDSIAEQNGILNTNGVPLSAESVAKSILDPSVDPGNRQAIQFLSNLEQPSVFNKTVTPKFAAQRDEVVRLLREAEGLAQSGRNDQAIRTYEAVLTIDPYNSAARKGMESIHSSNMKYANEAYNETRARMLWQVEKTWERPPRKSKQGRSTESLGRQQDIRGTERIVAQLNSIMIPRIDLSDSPISEAIEYLKQKSREQDPAKKGVNIFLKLGQSPTATPTQPTTPESGTAAPASPAEPHITIALSNVPLYEALKYISKLSNLKLKIEPYAVSIVPLSEPTDVIVKGEYQVPPTFIPPKLLDSAGSLPQPGTAGVPDPNKARVAQKMDAKEYLSSQGVEFPPGSSAKYISAGSKLVVYNTRDNIDLIDSLVDAAVGISPTQVDIQTKFLEINQNNLQELGFDWLLGPFSVGGGVYGTGGGVPGAGANTTPFGNPMAGGYPMSSVGSLRSGNQAITGNSVDALLAGQSPGDRTAAPGIFSIAGVFSEPQFQLVIRALNQKKGVDLMSAPRVTTKSGVKATVKIINEFIYPKQYDPPQFNQAQAVNGGTTTVNPLTVPPPTVTPAFPRDFTEQDLGVVLEAKPTIGPDGYTIDLELNPKVTDFDGFINYGSPINGVGYQNGLFDVGAGIRVPALVPNSTTLTTNTINQPVFSVREVNTFVTVWDGQTVALGGLIREDVQKIQDKVPFLGDMPLAGRLFRSDADQKIKKNLVIFVTPRILDADGQPRRGDAEEPEIVKPLGLPSDLPQPSISSPAVRGK
jgi:general secretion pathway protein D